MKHFKTSEQNIRRNFRFQNLLKDKNNQKVLDKRITGRILLEEK